MLASSTVENSSFSSLLVATAAAAGLLAVVALKLRQKPLENIPGPFLARWTPIWLFFHSRIGQRYKAVHEAHMVC